MGRVPGGARVRSGALKCHRRSHRDRCRDHGFVVITYNLDFSALLVHSAAAGPSVIQVRTQDVLPEAIGADVVRVLRQHRAALEQGALVSLDELAARVRVLPLRRG